MEQITSPLDTDKVVYITHKEVVSEFVRWIVRLHPDTELPDLNLIASRLQEWWRPFFSRGAGGILEVGSVELRRLCEFCTQGIPEIKDLNLSKMERIAGVGVDDPSRPHFVGSSRYDRPLPEHDFIDLDALARNVALEIIKGQA